MTTRPSDTIPTGLREAARRNAEVCLTVVQILTDTGAWRNVWPTDRKHLEDGTGNRVGLFAGVDAVTVELEYSRATVVETMHLDPSTGAERIALIIQAATDTPPAGVTDAEPT